MGVGKLAIGDHVHIGHLNIIRGGDEVQLGRYSELKRMNEINSIPDPDTVSQPDPRFTLGAGSIITTGHKIDFTDRVEIGRRAIIGGRNSSLWTHNRQRTMPISVGDFALRWLGNSHGAGQFDSAALHRRIGSVITGDVDGQEWLIAGCPRNRSKN